MPEFQALYRQYFGLVWRVLRALGVSQTSLDDAVQEVFLVVFRRQAEFEGRAAILTWLYSITCRVASNFRRQARRKPTHDELPPGLASTTPSPFAQVEARDAWHLLERFLDDLSEEMRSVFVLALLEEVSAPEVAKVLSIPVNTVYSRLHQMRQSFRHLLTTESGGPP